MSEKRFVLSESKFAIIDKKENKTYYFDSEDSYTLRDLLNELADENRQLRQTVQHLEEEIGARENDIKRLKRQVKTFKEDRDSNFKSAQYFREQLMKIPKSIRSVWIE